MIELSFEFPRISLILSGNEQEQRPVFDGGRPPATVFPDPASRILYPIFLTVEPEVSSNA